MDLRLFAPCLINQNGRPVHAILKVSATVRWIRRFVMLMSREVRVGRLSICGQSKRANLFVRMFLFPDTRGNYCAIRHVIAFLVLASSLPCVQRRFRQLICNVGRAVKQEGNQDRRVCLFVRPTITIRNRALTIRRLRNAVKGQ